jgi:hypothetical protein
VIRETRSRKHNPALTSDQWHVVQARWTGNTNGEPLFARSIVSEHDKQADAMHAAREMESSVAAEVSAARTAHADQLFVRPPAFRTLKIARFRDQSKE